MGERRQRIVLALSAEMPKLLYFVSFLFSGELIGSNPKGKNYHKLQRICCHRINFSCPCITGCDESSATEEEINQEQVPTKVRSTADRVMLMSEDMSAP